MKKILTTLIALLLFCNLQSQDYFWTVYHMEVKAGHESELASGLNKFFASETGKKLPLAAFGSALFKNSSNKWTHEVRFASPNVEDFGKMYSGALQQTLDFQFLENLMNDVTKPVASYLGMQIMGNGNQDARYSMVFELSVENVDTYVASFKALHGAIMEMTDNGLSLTLHQFISGNEPGATHAVVASATSLDALLKYTSQVGASPVYKEYSEKNKDNVKLLRQFSTVTTAYFNTPEGADSSN